MNTARILVVEDDPDMLETISEALRRANHDPQPARSGPQACELLKTQSLDLVITDIRMPGLGGLDVLKCAHETDAGLPVLMITGYPSVDTAVASFRTGATDYLVKPFTSKQLLESVDRVLQGARQREADAILMSQIRDQLKQGGILGRSPWTLRLYDQVRRLAALSAPILLVGEPGSGRQTVARALHAGSTRASHPFVLFGAMDLPESEVARELFGEPGEIVGTERWGAISRALHGVLFIDEIAALPSAAQERLGHLLERGWFSGQTESSSIPDVRLIASTSLDPESSVAQTSVCAGRKLEIHPLLLRYIGTVRVNVPPLRDRVEDIPVLARHFASVFAHRHGRDVAGLSADAIAALLRHPWPGNVRELRTVTERAVLAQQESLITAEDLGIQSVDSRPPASTMGTYHYYREQVLDTLEMQYVEAALRAHHGNVSQTADALQIHRTSLQRLLRRHGLRSEDFRHGAV